MKKKLTLVSDNPDFATSVVDDYAEQFIVKRISREEDLFKCDSAKCLIVIDIDSLMDRGFTLASKLSQSFEGKCILVAVTTHDIDSRDSKFHFFLKSIEDFHQRYTEIMQKYDEV